MNNAAFLEGYLYKEAGKGAKLTGLMANPINLLGLGNFGGMVTAGLTDTQTPEEASKGNTGFWNATKDVLVPGRAAHSIYKSMGSIVNNPEFEKVKEHLRRLGKGGHADDAQDINRMTQDMYQKILAGEYHNKDNTRTMKALLEMVAKQRQARGFHNGKAREPLENAIAEKQSA